MPAKPLIQLAFLLSLTSFSMAARCAISPESTSAAVIAQGVALREQGNLHQSIDLLNFAMRSIDAPDLRAMAAGELGVAHLQAHHYDLAENFLQKAYAFFSGAERGRYAIYLGNLAFIFKRPTEAKRFYQEALDLSGGKLDVKLAIGLNLARLSPEAERLDKLAALSRQMAEMNGSHDLLRHHINLGNQARLLGGKGLALSYRHLNQARQLSLQTNDKRSSVEALDALAQLYEDQGRETDALILNTQAIDMARALDGGTAADLLIQLEWRYGRLLKAQGKEQAALAAYQRAVYQIELVRQDLPVEHEDGRSFFRHTLEPIFLGYVDLLLRQLEQQTPASQSARLQNVLDVMELVRQTELQDFLGDRCAVETGEGGSADRIPARTAVLYPIILPDHMELLLKTSDGILRRQVQVDSASLRVVATAFAASLRGGLANYPDASRQLYDWLLKPFDEILAVQQIQALVVVPDGVLRLVPIAALHDGKQFAIEKYAISMVTAMSVTNTAVSRGRKILPLLAGVSEPGLVVEKLGPFLGAQIFQPVAAIAPARGRDRGSLTALDSRSPAAKRFDRLRARLALPGVKEEIKAIGDILGGVTLLDAAFTVDHFRQAAESGDYRIVHIASHGVFGGNAETSFLMAHDDVISINNLQSVLNSEKFKKNPIELLTLSACETAEGNDRAPLGIAGAATRARAKSVLGTLWPVEDNAARTLMEEFYTGISGAKLTKTEALRQAQIQLIQRPEYAHPLFWAPFVLIGNWL